MQHIILNWAGFYQPVNELDQTADHPALSPEFGHTAKKVIGNILSLLKSASLMIKNTISILGIFFATHNMLFYIIDSKKIFQPIRWVKIL